MQVLPPVHPRAILATYMEAIILASASPRRRELLDLLGIPFVLSPAGIDETPPPGMTPRQVAEHLARAKALAVADSLPPSDSLLPSDSRTAGPDWVLAADTVAALDGETLGKPADRDEARAMLGRLAGREHSVVTAIALRNGRGGGIDARSAECGVRFAPLSPAEIEWYLDTGEWEGAAGGYRLQGKGACLVERVDGEPSAVEGLPLRAFYVMLRENGFRFGA